MDTVSKTYRIFSENLTPLMRLVEKLNRRATKLGLAPIVVTTGAKEYVTQEDGLTVDEFLPVTIEGQTPRLNGWEFVATLQHAGEAGNILRTVPTFEGMLPEAYRYADPGNCDHCHQYRRRNDTYVVRKDDVTWAQVGRNCLADFVGSDKVGRLADMAEIISLLDEAARGYGEGGDRRLGESMLVLEEGIAYAAEAMLRAGWLSRSKAEAANKTATAELAMGAMRNRGKPCTWKCGEPCLSHFEPSDRARKLAEDALAWAPEWIERELAREARSGEGIVADRTSSGDYIWNMKVVLSGDVIPTRSFNLAASVLGGYQREMERAERIESTRIQSTSEYVGSVGERITLTLTTRAFRYLNTDYGDGVATLITYHTPEGNVVKWFASGQHEVELDQTDTYEATVKQHREYEGIKETHVLRVKPYVSPEDKKALAKARKVAKGEYERLLAESQALYAALPSYDDPTHDEAYKAYADAQKASRDAYNLWKDI